MPFVRQKARQVLVAHSTRTGSQVTQRVLARFATRAELAKALTASGWLRWTKSMGWRHSDVRWNFAAMRKALEDALTDWDAAKGAVRRRGARSLRTVSDALRHRLEGLNCAGPVDAALLLDLGPSLRDLRASIDRILAPAAKRAEQEARPLQGASKTMERTVLDSQTPADDLLDAGMELWWEGDRGGACRLYRQALKLDPLHSDSHNHLGIVALERADLARAEKHFRAAVEGGARYLERDERQVLWGLVMNRPYLRGLKNLALTLRRRGRHEEALALHRQLLELNPNDNQGVRYLIGEDLHRLGRLIEATLAYRATQDEANCCFNLAVALLEQKSPAKQIGSALLRGFAHNRYVAPMLLGEPWKRLDGFHGTNLAEPGVAADYVSLCGDLWQRLPEAAVELRRWWTADPVRTWRENRDRIMVALKTEAIGEKRSRLVSQMFALDDDALAPMVRAVLAKDRCGRLT